MAGAKSGITTMASFLGLIAFSALIVAQVLSVVYASRVPSDAR